MNYLNNNCPNMDLQFPQINFTFGDFEEAPLLLSGGKEFNLQYTDSCSETTGDINQCQNSESSPESCNKEENIDIFSMMFKTESFDFNCHVNELISCLEDDSKKAKRIVS